VFTSQSGISRIFICGLLLHVLQALKTIHKEWIVYSNLKLANFLLSKGELKFMDFGIAKAIQNDTTNIVRKSQVCHSFWMIYLL